MKPSKYEERKTLPVLVLYCPYYLLPSTSRFDGFSAAVMLLSWDPGHRSSVEGGGRSMTMYPLATKRPTRQPIRTMIKVFTFSYMFFKDTESDSLGVSLCVYNRWVVSMERKGKMDTSPLHIRNHLFVPIKRPVSVGVGNGCRNELMKYYPAKPFPIPIHISFF